MLQHLALLFIVPPLLLASRPFDLFARVAGKRLTLRAVRLLKPLHALASPPVALGIFVAVLWLTHVTPLYEIALEHPVVHVFEHSLYLGAGLAFWLPLMDVPPVRPLSYPARLLYALVALPQCALLGFVLGAAREAWYPYYLRQTSMEHALADQHNAAAVMWIAGGLAVLLALLATLGRWARREADAPAFERLAERSMNAGYSDCTYAARSSTWRLVRGLGYSRGIGGSGSSIHAAVVAKSMRSPSCRSEGPMPPSRPVAP
jgi:putative membrane protein